MKWYQLKEQAAGEKRLLCLWFIYRMFGEQSVRFLVFFITLFAFIGAKEPKRCSKKYLSIIGIKPTFWNSFRHFLAYSNSLVDRMEVFAGKYNSKKIVFDSEDDKKMMYSDLKNGAFFICSHLGNIDIMRAFLFDEPDKHVNVFLSKEQCKIFNNFIHRLEVPTNATMHPVEDVSVETSIEIKDKISNGEIVIMAGDRISKHSTNCRVKFLGHNIQIPLGTFRFAQLMECPIYFVCALNEENGYRIYLKKFVGTGKKNEVIEKMQLEYIQFLEKLVKAYPLQFFHFYDFFE